MDNFKEDKAQKIYLLPVGDIDTEFFTRLATCLEERFLYKVKIMNSMPMPPQAYNVIKKQYFTNTIMERMKRIMPRDAKFLIGVADVDIYLTSLNFVFGQASAEDRTALISIYRLHPEFYGEAPDDDVLFTRILKEATHELGHLMGSKHCFNNQCIMYFSNSIFDTDRKGTLFCSECEKKIKKHAFGV